MNKLQFNNFLTIPLLLFLIFNLTSYNSFSQEKPKPEKDEISIPVFIHGLNSKADVEKVQKILNTQNWVKYALVEDWPQKHTHLIIKNNITPEQVNQLLKSEGFYILNKSFTDKRDTERSLVESHKLVNFKAEQFK
jgi:hypothetical protein